ncbi:MAG: hypothetical protein KA116_05265 [Proteobacteria bacterium]|nr:hypothetical protein [Pseudomonadota bacterium]
MNSKVIFKSIVLFVAINSLQCFADLPLFCSSPLAAHRSFQLAQSKADRVFRGEENLASGLQSKVALRNSGSTYLGFKAQQDPSDSLQFVKLIHLK